MGWLSAWEGYSATLSSIQKYSIQQKLRISNIRIIYEDLTNQNREPRSVGPSQMRGGA